MLSSKGNIHRVSDVPTAAIGGDLLMMSVEMGQYFSLNPVGTRVWELLDKPTTAEELVKQLVAEYDVHPEVCAAQVTNFLAELRQRKLLTDVS